MNKLLLIDIGGTNMRYATAYSDSDEISTINKKAFNETTFYKNLEELIKEHNINTLIMSVAGPKIDNSITMTNKNFSFNQNNLKEKGHPLLCFSGNPNLPKLNRQCRHFRRHHGSHRRPGLG